MNANDRAISVSYWNVNNSSEFMNAVNEFHNAMKEKEGVVREYSRASSAAFINFMLLRFSA